MLNVQKHGITVKSCAKTWYYCNTISTHSITIINVQNAWYYYGKYAKM